MITKASRLDQARTLWDHALSLLRAHGSEERVSGIRLHTWKTGPWSFSFRTPFSGPIPHFTLAKDDPRACHAALLLQQRGGRINLDYGLDIWRGPKVFLAEWDAKAPDNLQIATFKRGAWEDELLALSQPGAAE